MGGKVKKDETWNANDKINYLGVTFVSGGGWRRQS